MKLFSSPTSPFVRKILIQLHESEMSDRVELIDLSATGLSPVSPVQELDARNPLGKIPALVLEEDTLFDSRVIAEYLDTLHGGPRLLPASGPERFAALRQVALADGICDAAVLVRYETVVRPEALRWGAWVEGQLAKIRRAVAVLDGEGLADRVHLGTIAAAVALGYLDLRYPDADLWRTAHPGLVTWYERFAERPSMRATAPTG